ncbi:MAG: hypothetical protein ACYC6L_12030, partial [Anaerolineae bacterium]
LLGNLGTPYKTVIPSTTLKVSGIDLTSIGEVNPVGDGVTEIRQQDNDKGTYKKLVIYDGVIVGAILLGDRQNVRAVGTLIDKGIKVTGREDRLLEPNLDIASL